MYTRSISTKSHSTNIKKSAHEVAKPKKKHRKHTIKSHAQTNQPSQLSTSQIQLSLATTAKLSINTNDTHKHRPKSVIRQLLHFSRHLPDMTTDSIMSQLSTLKQATISNQNSHTFFISSMIAILEKSTTADTNTQQQNNIKNDCRYEILQVTRHHLFSLPDLHIPLQIIENIIAYLLTRSTTTPLLTDDINILLYKSFKLLYKISTGSFSANPPSQPCPNRQKYEKLAANIIIRILIAYTQELSAILDLIFSLYLGHNVKHIVIRTMVDAINNHDALASQLPFTSQELMNAFDTKTTQALRSDLLINIYDTDSGSFSNVYSAKDTASENRVAIKFFKSNATIFSARVGLAFLCRTKHPNIISFHTPIVRGENVGYVMEYANYNALGDYMLLTSRPNQRFLDFATQINIGLTYIHSLGYIHNDLKPENILVTGDEDVRTIKISDFDTLKKIGAKQNRNLCTIEYSSPEHHLPNITHQPESDIFSYGGVVFYMATRKIPWTYEATIYTGAPNQWRSEIIRYLSLGITPKFDCYINPGAIYKLINWCWQISPKQRPSHEEIAVCIEEIIKSTLPRL